MKTFIKVVNGANLELWRQDGGSGHPYLPSTLEGHKEDNPTAGQHSKI